MFPSQISFAILDYGKYCFTESCKRIKISKSWYIQVMTIQRSFTVVKSLIIMVNDYWPAVILSAEKHSSVASHIAINICTHFTQFVHFVYIQKTYNGSFSQLRPGRLLNDLCMFNHSHKRQIIWKLGPTDRSTHLC